MRITRNMPFADYAAIEAVNFSTVKHMATSPKHYRHAVDCGKADTGAMRIGRLAHSMILNSDTSEVAIYGGKVRRGKEWESFISANVGAEIVTASEVESTSAMRAAVMSHPVARGLLTGGEPEMVIEWSADGIDRKARLDYVTAKGSLVELKTTRIIHPRAFAAECARRDYPAQVAWYLDAMTFAKLIGTCAAYIVAVENVAPFDVAVFEVPDAALEVGRRKIDAWTKTLTECRASGEWPGVAPTLQALTLPDWALTDGLEDVDTNGIEGGEDGSE